MPMFLSCGRTFSVIHDFVKFGPYQTTAGDGGAASNFCKKKIISAKFHFGIFNHINTSIFLLIYLRQNRCEHQA
jgi:hypothetical protein